MKEQNVTANPLEVEDAGKMQLLELVQAILHQTTYLFTLYVKTVSNHLEQCNLAAKKLENIKIAENKIALFSWMYIFC